MLWRSCGERALLTMGRSWWTSTRSRRQSWLQPFMRMMTQPPLMRTPSRQVPMSCCWHDLKTDA